MVFADLDKAFAVVGANGFIGRWKLPSFTEYSKSCDAEQEGAWSDYKSIDFVKEPKEPSSSQSAENEPLQLVVVGTDQN